MAVLVARAGARAGDPVGDWLYSMDGTVSSPMSIVTLAFSATLSMLPLDDYGRLNTAALRELAGCANAIPRTAIVEVYSHGIEYEVRVQCKVRRD